MREQVTEWIKMRSLRSLQGEKKNHFISLWDLFLMLIITETWLLWPVVQKSLLLVTTVSLDQLPIRPEKPHKIIYTIWMQVNICSYLQSDTLLSELSLLILKSLQALLNQRGKFQMTGNKSSHTCQLFGIKTVPGCALQTWHSHSLISWHSESCLNATRGAHLK